MKTLYEKRNPRKQGKFYTDHVMAMTEEGLHEKSDIAAELAHRDIEIDFLQRKLGKMKIWGLQATACMDLDDPISKGVFDLYKEAVDEPWITQSDRFFAGAPKGMVETS